MAEELLTFNITGLNILVKENKILVFSVKVTDVCLILVGWTDMTHVHAFAIFFFRRWPAARRIYVLAPALLLLCGPSYNLQLSSTLVKILISLNTKVIFLFTFIGNPYVKNRGCHISNLQVKDHRAKSYYW